MAVKTIEWRDNSVRMIDQRLLPAREIIRIYKDYKGVANAIRTMVIRARLQSELPPQWASR